MLRFQIFLRRSSVDRRLYLKDLVLDRHQDTKQLNGCRLSYYGAKTNQVIFKQGKPYALVDLSVSENGRVSAYFERFLSRREV